MEVLRKEKLRQLYASLYLPFTNLPLLSRRLRETWREEGVEGLFLRIQRRIVPPQFYDYPVIVDEEREQMLSQIARFNYLPRFSIVMPVYNVGATWLRYAIDSVVQQIYPHWELCIADDASTLPHIPEILKEYARKDPRIRFKRLAKNQHISGASNEALSLARGDYVALLDHDDELTPDALFRVTELLNRHPEADMIYSDEDKLDASGRLTTPHFKPDWAPDLFLSQMYSCHLGVYRRSIVEKIKGFRKGYEGSQDYDFVLRFLDHKPQIFHIPKILYHWRMLPSSAASSSFVKDYADKAALRGLQDYLDRNKIDATVEPGKFFLSYRVRYHLRKPLEVAIIMPTRNHVALLRTAIESLRQKTSYSHYHLYVVNNDSDDPETLAYLKELNPQSWATVIECPGPFNFSAINNYAVAQVKESIVLFLNNDVEIIEKDWLTSMVEHIQRPEIGIVGSKLLYPDGTIQHAGVILGAMSLAGHSHRHLPGHSPGYFGRIFCINNVSAVTGACMMTRREIFEACGGFDEKNLAIAFNDIDYCLKVLHAGYRIVFTPYAELIHHESKSRGLEDTPEKKERFVGEIRFFLEKWKEFLQKGDPYYNPNLSLDSEDFSVKEGVLQRAEASLIHKPVGVH